MSSKSTLATDDQGIWIAYDGECPFCSAYVEIVRLKEAVGPVRLIDARGADPFLDEVRAAGMDINGGMAAKYGGRLYYGDEVLNLFAMLTSESGTINRMLAALFRSPKRARFLYPAMVTGRNLTLRLMGRKRIDWPV